MVSNAWLAAPAPLVRPERGDWLDLVLVAIAVVYAVVGYRRGLVVSALSLSGFVAGAVLGGKLAPGIAGAFLDQPAPDALAQRLLALAVVLVVGSTGRSIGAFIGARVRRAVSLTPARWVDSAGGAVLDATGFLLVAWLLGYLLASSPFPSVVREIRRSAVLQAVDKVMPISVSQLFADLNRLLQRHDLPAVGNPFAALPVLPSGLAPPDAGSVPPALRAAGAQVVKITGVAPSCGREVEGSGFIYATDRVMTNAHVVAGVRNPKVALPAPNARVLDATVVLYDPDRDVAVLRVPGLGRAPLRFAGRVKTGDSAVVAGYPEGGPLRAVPARIAGEQEITGPNIYRSRQVTREVYTLRGRVRPGNSGGPLLSPQGTVDGVVFAASVDNPQIGYALTAQEVSGDARRGAMETSPVSTQGCD